MNKTAVKKKKLTHIRIFNLIHTEIFLTTTQCWINNCCSLGWLHGILNKPAFKLIHVIVHLVPLSSQNWSQCLVYISRSSLIGLVLINVSNWVVSINGESHQGCTDKQKTSGWQRMLISDDSVKPQMRFLFLNVHCNNFRKIFTSTLSTYDNYDMVKVRQVIHLVKVRERLKNL